MQLKVAYCVQTVRVKPTHCTERKMKKLMKNKLVRQNQRSGLRNAYYQSTGKQAKTLKEAAAHFGVKVP